MPLREPRWHFDNLGDVHAVDAPCVDGVHSPAVTPAIHLFDLVDGVTCLLLGDVDAVVQVHAIEAQAVSPLYPRVFNWNKAHLRRAGGEPQEEGKQGGKTSHRS